MTDHTTGENAPNQTPNAGNTAENRDNKGRFRVGNKANPSGVFSKDNQPTGEAKSIGRKKKIAGRNALLELLSLPIVMEDKSAVKQELISVFGKKAVKKATAYEIAAMRQIVKAVKANDTQAFIGISNQAFGTLQKMEHSGPGGAPIEMQSQVTRVVVVKNPHSSEQSQ